MSRHIRTNPTWNKDEIKNFKKLIKDNNGHCPCTILENNDTKCMCLAFRNKIWDCNYVGTCDCGLYAVVEEE
jgi:hypothetical protein